MSRYLPGTAGIGCGRAGTTLLRDQALTWADASTLGPTGRSARGSVLECSSTDVGSDSRALPPKPPRCYQIVGGAGELGAGLSLRLTSFLALTPGIQYEKYTTDVNIDEAFQRQAGGKRPYQTSYFIFDLGLRLKP